MYWRPVPSPPRSGWWPSTPAPVGSTVRRCRFPPVTGGAGTTPSKGTRQYLCKSLSYHDLGIIGIEPAPATVMYRAQFLSRRPDHQPGVLMTRALRGLAALTLLAVAPLSAQNPITDRMLSLPG